MTVSICFARCGDLGALGHMCLLLALGACVERGYLPGVSFQNPDLDSEALLALPLTQLVQKLHSGELSPEAALFTYVGKVRPGHQGSSLSLQRLWGKNGLEFVSLRARVGQCQGLPGAA